MVTEVVPFFGRALRHSRGTGERLASLSHRHRDQHDQKSQFEFHILVPNLILFLFNRIPDLHILLCFRITFSILINLP